MGFSPAERERRHGAMRRIMEADGLKALLLLGDTNVGSDIYGDFRYLTENLIPPSSRPTARTPFSGERRTSSRRAAMSGSTARAMNCGRCSRLTN